MNLIDQALKEGRTTLSEYESKQVLASYGIPVTQEELVSRPEDLYEIIRKIGYPLVMKGCASQIAHKTEKGLIRLDIRNENEARTAFDDITAAMPGTDQAVLVHRFQ